MFLILNMAIQFARIEILSRKSGGNACCKGAYNARSKIVDEKTGEIFVAVYSQSAANPDQFQGNTQL